MTTRALFVRLSLTVMGALLCMAGAGCSREPTMPQPPSRLTLQPFGLSPANEPIDLITLANGYGMEVRVMTYGGIIVSLKTPDRDGRIDDIVLGHDEAAGYFTSASYFGAIVGRYANRIAAGRFLLDGREYTLATNDGPNHLHGGVRGWDKVVWRAEPFNDARGVGVELTHTSPAGDEGYPGTVRATVTYTLRDPHELEVAYAATTDAPTIINLSQHTYFNLAGSAARPVLDHLLTIHADRYTPVDEGLIPTGELASVAGTPFDFRTATPIGARIGQRHPQLERGRGYDHNFVLARAGDDLEPAATVYEPSTGRTLEVLTTEPGLQFYSGNFLDGTVKGKGGITYAHRTGFCLETQHFPDSPNRPDFPTTTLGPGGDYRSTTVFRFGTAN